MNIITLIIRSIFFLVALSMWLVVGTCFWIGLLLRAGLMHAAMFLYSMFTHQEPKDVSGQIQAVSELWFSGFKRAYNSSFGGGSGEPLTWKPGALIAEIFWCTVSLVGTVAVSLFWALSPDDRHRAFNGVWGIFLQIVGVCALLAFTVLVVNVLCKIFPRAKSWFAFPRIDQCDETKSAKTPTPESQANASTNSGEPPPMKSATGGQAKERATGPESTSRAWKYYGRDQED